MVINVMPRKNIMKSNAPLLAIISLFALFIFLNLPVMTTLWRHSFDDGTYSHAYLIPVISLWLYYQLQQDNILVFRANISWLGIILFVLSCYGLFVSASAQISLGYWLASLGIIISAILMLFKYHWRILFPTLFLILIIPMWGSLATILQGLSVIAVSFMMSFTGIPTFVEGNLVSIPAGVFEIAGGCSGLRYFIVSIAISSLFVFLNMRNTRNILIFLGVAIIGALITNWIRITLLIIIGQYTDMTSSLMTDHNHFGWYVFLPFMILLFTLGNYLAPDSSDSTAKEHDVTTVKKTSLAFISLGLLVSSTGIANHLSVGTSLITTSFENYKTQQELTPFVQFYSHVNNKRIIVNDTPIDMKTFIFSGGDLDAKPTFYNNKTAPNSWKVKNKTKYQQWNILTLQKNQMQSLVATSFQLNRQVYSNRKAFKIERIKAGFIGTNTTKLHWLTISCNSDCTSEQAVLTQALDNFKAPIETL